MEMPSNTKAVQDSPEMLDSPLHSHDDKHHHPVDLHAHRNTKQSSEEGNEVRQSLSRRLKSSRSRHADSSLTQTGTRSPVLPHTYEAGDPYYIGDIYEESQIRCWWSRLAENNDWIPGRYLNHVDWLTDNGWPSLRYLGDWMRVSTSPPQWRFLDAGEMRERASRVKITLLEFGSHLKIRHDITNIEDLAFHLSSDSYESEDAIARFFVVEDLSRDVIETLGSALDVDPMFFRGHISDYTWYNTRDPWTELPEMDLVSRFQSFFHVRYAQTRYFREPGSYARARLETGSFNVLRRINPDGNWIPGADIPGSDVGMVRCRMSFWVQPQNTGIVTAILLVDPSVTEGYPLWGGHNDLGPSPSMADKPPERRKTESTFENVIYWLEKMSSEEIATIAQDPRMLFLKPLCWVCSEWLTLARYGYARLSQLEWEVEDPYLRHRYKDLSATLDKIHSWRRRLPIYKNLLSEVLKKCIQREYFPHASQNSLLAIEKDFKAVWSEVDDLHQRAERIISVVTAVMSIDESKKGLQQDRSLARLTYLAVTFVPLSFVSSFFSMTDDVTKLGQTFWIYFSVAVPVTLLALIVVRFSDAMIDMCHRITRRFRRRRT